MKRIAQALLAGILFVTVFLAISGALYEMIGRWRDARRFPESMASTKDSRREPLEHATNACHPSQIILAV